MNIPVRLGFTYWEENMKYFKDLKNSGIFGKTYVKIRLRPWGMKMEENSLQMNSNIFAKKLGLRGRSTHPIILNRME